jgi:outer membrane protein assembly factor BamB
MAHAWTPFLSPGQQYQRTRFNMLLSLLILFVVARSRGQVAMSDSNQLLHVVWRTVLHVNDQAPQGHPTTSPSRLFLVQGGIAAYSRKEGKLEWQVPVGKYLPQSLLYKSGAIFVAEERITALDENDGHTLWEFSPEGNASLGRASIHGKTLCFGTDSHRVYALNIHDGRKLWVTDLGPDWKFRAIVRGAAMDARSVFVSVEQWRTENGNTSTGWLIALSVRTGEVLWRYRSGYNEQRHGMSSSPTVTRNLVLVADYLSNAIVAVNRSSGREVWRFEGEHPFVGFPEAPLVTHRVVYAASGDKNVYALSLQTGRLLWRSPMPASNRAFAMCGKSLLVNYEGLAVLDTKTGRIQQTLLQGDDEFPTSGFARAGKTVYFGGHGAVYAFTCK